MTTDEAPAPVRARGPAPDLDGSLTPPAGTPEVASRGIGWLEVVVLFALVGVGAAIRAHGFTRFDLWFDDAWAAAPAKVGLSKAVHMVLTAPGYSLALRSWLRLDPATTWFGQLPAYFLGLCAITAVYVLLRYFRATRLVALVGAAVVAMGPLTVQYSTRLKEYPFDLLAACALLVLAERVRRKPTQRRVVVLAAASVVLVLFSASSAPVVAACWIALALALYRDPRSRRYLAVWGSATVLGCAAVWAVFLRHIPTVLSYNWRRRGFLMDYRSLGLAERSTSLMFGGFFHAVLGYPVPGSFFQTARGFHDLAVTVLGVVVLAVAISVPIVGSIRRRRVTPALPASLTLLLAVVLALADQVPMGDGRTDEVLYPALLVCLAAACTASLPAWRRLLGTPGRTRLVGATLAGVVLCASVAFGVSHPAKYPTISLRGVAAKLRTLTAPGDVVFVDTFNSFAWCYYELSPCTFKVGGTPPWPQGFRPVSLDPARYFLPSHYGIPLPELTHAEAHARRIWYVGYTYGTYDVGSNPALYQLPVPSYMKGLLAYDGWRPARPGPTTEIFGLHAYAQLYVHRGR